ncbi:hypothetical protein RHGRI_026297 [Rhododendron griersonianum]|uniref:Uncharacterized protein n=1 Tax=Rhododendron griersonianum TaxID=479676 RepID=A0AAV6IVP8_9ERIC|nr:hypothetical protein RHGRI_026297 [Rhododendron griersonianum]
MVVDRHRKALLQVGSKSLELVDGGEGDRLRYGLVEQGSGLWGFYKERAGTPFSFGKGFYFEGGTVEVRDSGRAWHVLVLELCGNGGWVDISKNFWAFCGRSRSEGRVDGRSFLEAANIGGWPENTMAVEEKGEKRRGCDVDVRADSTQKMMRFLERCLVGRMEKGGVALPVAMEVQRWAQKTWKVTAGVQVLELGGFLFLFSLPSFE